MYCFTRQQRMSSECREREYITDGREEGISNVNDKTLLTEAEIKSVCLNAEQETTAQDN